MATKRIKLIKAWGMSAAGAEVEFDAPIADLLILRGRAREVAEVAEEIVIKVVLDPVQTPAPVRKLKRKKGKR